MKIIYGENEKSLINQLLAEPIPKIWHDFVSYIFDFNGYYIELSCTVVQADSQNEFDEAIYSSIQKIDQRFIPTKDVKLICENKTISNIYIVRTLLYFSTFKYFSTLEKKSNRFIYKLKAQFTKKSDPIENLLSQTTGAGEEIICHPESDEASNVSPEISNLLDVGLLIEIDGKYLRSFVEYNGFGYHIWNDNYFNSDKCSNEDQQYYEFIKFEQFH